MAEATKIEELGLVAGDGDDLLETVDIPSDLGELLQLVVEKAGGGRLLYDVIQEVLPGEQRFDLRRSVERVFSRKVDAQSGRTGAQLLQRCITKTIDAQVESVQRGLDVEERLALSQELANNTARELIRAALAVVAYPALACAVVVAKEAVDIPALSAGRRARTGGVEAVKDALLNAARTISGDDPR